MNQSKGKCACCSNNLPTIQMQESKHLTIAATINKINNDDFVKINDLFGSPVKTNLETLILDKKELEHLPLQEMQHFNVNIERIDDILKSEYPFLSFDIPSGQNILLKKTNIVAKNFKIS